MRRPFQIQDEIPRICIDQLSVLFHSALYPLFVPNNAPEYVIPESEVGRRIIFKYTPISTEGEVGEPVFATSPIIELAAPKVTGLGIVGSLLEGSRVSLLGKYAGGGKEGQSEVQWFKSRDGGVGTSMEALPQFDNRKVRVWYRLPGVLSFLNRYFRVQTVESCKYRIDHGECNRRHGKEGLNILFPLDSIVGSENSFLEKIQIPFLEGLLPTAEFTWNN
jgi:hypothetical protein